MSNSQLNVSTPLPEDKFNNHISIILIIEWCSNCNNYYTVHVHWPHNYLSSRLITQVACPVSLHSVVLLKDGTTLIGGGSDGNTLIKYIYYE